MEYDSLHPDAKFMFNIMMKAALKAKSIGFPKKKFVNFASECWDTMLLNDPDKLSEIIESAMLDDIKKFVENIKE